MTGERGSGNESDTNLKGVRVTKVTNTKKLRDDANGNEERGCMPQGGLLFGVLLFEAVIGLAGCGPDLVQAGDTGEPPAAVVTFGAAFGGLDHVDVYSEDGVWVATVDAGQEFSEVLSSGTYFMDFVDDRGIHSFFEDGRVAFAPMTDGATPINGPFDVDGIEAPVWEVAVHPVLEGNARLIERIDDGDPDLDAFLPLIDPSFFDLEGLDGAEAKAYSSSTSSATASKRLRVTWEASFAMTGNYSGSGTCNSGSSCWQGGSTSTPTTVYAKYGAATSGKGYIDYDTAAWSAGRSAYGSTTGYVSCRDNTAAFSGITCSPTIGSSDAGKFTCQSTTGTCSATTYPRGGECKFFSNLLIYRSGQYTSGGSWKTLPSDATISASTATYPVLTAARLEVGDVLRYPYGHSMIVAAIDTATAGSEKALVVDSNYVGTTSTTYREYIGAHVVGFGSSYSGSARLSNYRDLDCVYTGGC